MHTRTILQSDDEYPEVLAHIPDPPKRLFAAGQAITGFMQRPRVAIVGSRKVSAYGKAVTTQLARGLAQAGVVIVSGLAIGVDGLAHRAALEAGGTTIAVLPGSLDEIYPSGHVQLARQIVEQGGLLLSEYAPGAVTYKTNFVARNRIVSGLCDGVLITEAALKSGTLHTARFALEQGREVMAVPGNITSTSSEGTNNLIRAGAVPVTALEDIFHALGIAEPAARKQQPSSREPHEQLVLDLVAAGTQDGNTLLQASNLDAAVFNQIMTMLEISGKIRTVGGNQWALR